MTARAVLLIAGLFISMESYGLDQNPRKIFTVNEITISGNELVFEHPCWTVPTSVSTIDGIAAVYVEQRYSKDSCKGNVESSFPINADEQDLIIPKPLPVSS